MKIWNFEYLVPVIYEFRQNSILNKDLCLKFHLLGPIYQKSGYLNSNWSTCNKLLDLRSSPAIEIFPIQCSCIIFELIHRKDQLRSTFQILGNQKLWKLSLKGFLFERFFEVYPHSGIPVELETLLTISRWCPFKSSMKFLDLKDLNWFRSIFTFFIFLNF